MNAWEEAFQMLIGVRILLGRQSADDPKVNRRRDQIREKLIDAEMGIAWLTLMAQDEERARVLRNED